MGTITKQNGANSYVNEYSTINGVTAVNRVRTPWTNTISYDSGPRVVAGHLNWKECRHSWRTPPTLAIASAHSSDWSDVRRLQSSWGWDMISEAIPGSSSLPSLNELWDGIWDQVDLNTGDSVLLYSGILQSIPLLGGALKGVSILNRAARRLKKDLRRKPFTAVVKGLIQADFINRFVVKPTIDDMQKFADSFDYVLRVIQTARQRNAELSTAFETEVTNVVSRSSSNQDYGYGFCRLRGTATTERKASAKLKVLAKVTYDTDVINPFKIWAKRVGLSKPLDSAWDMVPFSFVLDYFVRAGDFLSYVGDKLADDDGLKGRVASVFDAWLMQTRTAEFKFSYVATPYSSYWRGLRCDNEPITSSAGEFTRTRVPIMGASSFWDNGVVSVNLSSTRKRTLAELFVQSKLK